MTDPIQMLKQDHERVRAMLDRMKTVDPDLRHQMVADLERDLKIHSQLEEEIVYPAYRDATTGTEDRQLYFEATEEHHVMDMVVPELKMMVKDSERFVARVSVARELIQHHIEEEEEDMLPKLREMLGEQRLEQMGSRLVERKLELEKEWSSTVGKAMHKVKSVAEKFTPASAKELKEDRH